MKTAEEIVKALADWSNKYPRGRVYSMNKMSMDEELIEIENIAKEYANQSREEGSGKLPSKNYWYPIEYAGCWHILDEPFYEANNILDAECVGKQQAKINAELASKAPDLFNLLDNMAEYYLHEKKIESEELSCMQVEVMTILDYLKKQSLS